MQEKCRSIARAAKRRPSEPMQTRRMNEVMRPFSTLLETRISTPHLTRLKRAEVLGAGRRWLWRGATRRGDCIASQAEECEARHRHHASIHGRTTHPTHLDAQRRGSRAQGHKDAGFHPGLRGHSLQRSNNAIRHAHRRTGDSCQSGLTGEAEERRPPARGDQLWHNGVGVGVWAGSPSRGIYFIPLRPPLPLAPRTHCQSFVPASPPSKQALHPLAAATTPPSRPSSLFLIGSLLLGSASAPPSLSFT